MDNQEISKKYEEQKSALFAALGKFAVNFELLCFALRQGIAWMLHSGGLQKEGFADILLTNLTAEPLQSIYRSMVAELQKLSNNDHRIIKNVFKRVQSFIKERNDILHATWFIDWASSEDKDFSEARGFKSDKNKMGANIKIFRYKVDDFNKLSEKARNLFYLVNRLSLCLGTNFKIESNFEFD